jgi:hypothetical protein
MRRRQHRYPRSRPCDCTYRPSRTATVCARMAGLRVAADLRQSAKALRHRPVPTFAIHIALCGQLASSSSAASKAPRTAASALTFKQCPTRIGWPAGLTMSSLAS